MNRHNLPPNPAALIDAQIPPLHETIQGIARMDRQALTWWRAWKPIIKQIVDTVRSPDSPPEPSNEPDT